MVREQIALRGVRDERVLDAMSRVPRDHFVPPRFDPWADAAQPAGCQQTVSQPYIVGRMSALLDVSPGTRVLEIGTGSGYQAAVLRAMGAHVYGIERHRELIDLARARLDALGMADVQLHHGDGTAGWPREIAFDRILIAAAGPRLPRNLLDRQLKDGGLAVLPVGTRDDQQLIVARRTGRDFQITPVDPVRFVPLIGEEGWSH